MLFPQPRRTFLKSAAAGTMLSGLGDLGFLSHLPAVSAAELQLDRNRVPLLPEIEPLVQLLEETPRERLLEKVAEKIHQGTEYRQVLTALQLAGVRYIQPRPSVGHKFHAVLVVNSAHLASQASPAEHRWLPIFWSLDHFKSSQARDVQEGNWTMQRVDEARLPAGDQAAASLTAALDQWDEAAADVAIASLARHADLESIYEIMFLYGIRDFRSIGHKAIYVANSYRTLQEIGSPHAEPILRSLVYALLMHEGSNPAARDSEYDRDWRSNQQLMRQIRPNWKEGQLDAAATTQLLHTLRTGTSSEASALVVEQLNAGVSPQSIWDALLCAAGESLVREPGIPTIHNLTFTNATHYAYQTTQSDETRQLILLQNAAFLPWMRTSRLRMNGQLARFELDQLQAEPASKPAGEQLESIFEAITSNRLSAAQQVYRYLEAGNSAEDLLDQARLLVFLKGKDSHDYKFSSAVLEDYAHVSPAWRNRFLASSVFNLPGTKTADNQLVKRTRAALRS